MQTRALVLLLILSSLAFAQSEAGGGNITSANLNLMQPLTQWYFFYSSPQVSANATISLTDNGMNSGSNFLPVTLPATSGFYLISDYENPFTGEMRAANLGQFDSHFNLSDTESASRLFVDTSAYSLPEGISTPGGNLLLPTLYIPGQNDAHAFRVGIAQAGDHFIFVVPEQSARGMDNQSYDFQFFLPYSYSGMQTYHVFSITPPPVTTGAVVLKNLNYRWTYDGTRLTVQTEPFASLTMQDLLGKAYNAGADGTGLASLEIPPGRYTLRMQASGFAEVTDTLYLPAPVLKPDTTATHSPAGQNQSAKVTVQRSLDGITVCLEGDCYFQILSGADSTRLLTDLSCTGTMCELVDISPADYIQKHRMVRLASSPSQSAGPYGAPAMNVSALLDALGRGLSDRFGGTAAPTSSGSIATYFIGALLLGGAVFLLTKAWPMMEPKAPKGGYD